MNKFILMYYIEDIVESHSQFSLRKDVDFSLSLHRNLEDKLVFVMSWILNAKEYE